MAPTARLATILAFTALATAQTNPEDQAFIVSTTAPISAAAAQTVTVTATATITQGSATPTITAVSECHAHGTTNWCMADTEEYQISGPTATEEFQAQYTDCHKHGSEIYCIDDAGEDVEILVEFTEASGGTHSGETNEKAAGSEENCHYHAGVEHCVGGSKDVTCDATDRDYNMPLRVGLLFVILVTSAFGVFLPILTTRFNIISQTNIVLVILKQFGTGIVLSTAFIHLFTHADLMFSNECLGELQYEGTTAAVFLAGLFLSFLADYFGVRFVQWRQKKRIGADSETRGITTEGNDKGVSASASPEDDLNGSHGPPHAHGPFHHATVTEEKINVLNLEAGIIFHSILIGITLVVAGDSFFLTLFIVILFHQMFEGIALGACIAELPKAAASTVQKCIMAGAFALITPIGMAIGIGVLDSFNGNDPHTIVAIGTLDALSAGILAWVGIVDMLARDWMHGRLLNAGLMRTLLAMFALICGMILMSVLGKWA